MKHHSYQTSFFSFPKSNKHILKQQFIVSIWYLLNLLYYVKFLVQDEFWKNERKRREENKKKVGHYETLKFYFTFLI